MPLGVLDAAISEPALGSVNFLLLPVFASDLDLFVALCFLPFPDAFEAAFALFAFCVTDFVTDVFKLALPAAPLLVDVLVAVAFEAFVRDEEDDLLLLFVEVVGETIPPEVFDDGVDETPFGSSFPRFWVICRTFCVGCFVGDDCEEGGNGGGEGVLAFFGLLLFIDRVNFSLGLLALVLPVVALSANGCLSLTFVFDEPEDELSPIGFFGALNFNFSPVAFGFTFLLSLFTSFIISFASFATNCVSLRSLLYVTALVNTKSTSIQKAVGDSYLFSSSFVRTVPKSIGRVITLS
mmetsp:Transcript_7362/g.11184  ORF Transcript_7362/g.11184 Transcript_7362/m.11184 type:complete len:294 (-) Transcript_7362:249-1130(-)